MAQGSFPLFTFVLGRGNAIFGEDETGCERNRSGKKRVGRGSGSKGSRACGLPCEGLAGARRAVRGVDARRPRPAPWTGTLTAGHLALLGFAVAAVVAGLEAFVLHHRGHGRRQGRAGRPRLSAARGRPGKSAGARRGEDWGARPARAPRFPGLAPGPAPRVPSVLGPSRTLAGTLACVAVMKAGPFAYSIADPSHHFALSAAFCR